MENKKLVPLNKGVNTSSRILKTAEIDNSSNNSYTEYEASELQKYNTTFVEKEERRYSTGATVIKRTCNIKDANSKNGAGQPFPSIEESGETVQNKADSNVFENATYSLIMDNSFNVNIFSVTGGSSNIYSSESTELSTKNSQSLEVKLNIESSEIKKIIFDQIFRELVISEDLWTDIYKKMNTFDDEYIEYYKKIYDIYINPKGVVPMKLKSNSAKTIGLKISKSEYSYDMFFSILDEVATLIYEHVYLNLVI